MGSLASRRVPILGLLALAEFMLTLDLSVVTVALPSIRADLGFTPGDLQWVVNAYALTFGGFLLLGGRAADLFGGRRVFLAALGGFTLASLTCGLATAGGVLVAARAVQGLTAAVLSPATLSILLATYRQAEVRNRAMAVWTAVAIGGGAIGALVGGVLTELSWRWVFFVNVPVGAVLLLCAAARLQRDRRGARVGHLDVSGAVTVTVGLLALAWALTETSSGWGTPEVLGSLALAVVLLGVFVAVEALSHQPLVPLSTLRSLPVWAGNLLSCLSFLPVTATWFFLTLYLQNVRGYTPLQTGLLLVPLALAVVGGSQLGFRAIGGLDSRRLLVAGGVLDACGLFWLGRMSTHTSLLWVIVPACIAMLGGGLMFAPITITATTQAQADQEGLVSGLLNTSRQIGGALGLALLGSASGADHATGGPIAPGPATSAYTTALTLGGVMFLVTAVTGALALPSPQSHMGGP
jgi:EmrB/QacA subfamily drug resistance transporter